jgi:hypothetical protein
MQLYMALHQKVLVVNKASAAACFALCDRSIAPGD